MDLYIHSRIRLHGVELNELSTGTTLPLLLLYYGALYEHCLSVYVKVCYTRAFVMS
jgi:hypothetical protein